MTDSLDFDSQRVTDARTRLPTGVTIPRHVANDLGHGRSRPSAATRTWPWWPRVFPRPSSAWWDGATWALSQAQDEYDLAERKATAMEAGSASIAATRQAREARDQEERDKATDAWHDAQADQLKADLRARYLALPGTTEADFETAYPELLAGHRSREMNEHEAETTRGISRILRAAF